MSNSEDTVTIYGLAEELGIPSGEVIKLLEQMGKYDLDEKSEIDSGLAGMVKSFGQKSGIFPAETKQKKSDSAKSKPNKKKAARETGPSKSVKTKQTSKTKQKQDDPDTKEAKKRIRYYLEEIRTDYNLWIDSLGWNDEARTNIQENVRKIQTQAIFLEHEQLHGLCTLLIETLELLAFGNPEEVQSFGSVLLDIIHNIKDSIDDIDNGGKGEIKKFEKFISELANIDNIIVASNAPIEDEIEKKGEPKTLPFTPEIAILSADRADTDREDCLGIGPDVDAMASLICYRQMDPPLSIGLFGDWGAGKSFYMNELHGAVDKFSGQSGEHYWGNVCQVRFNAWHYVDSNLWASLASHIFEQLATFLKEGERESIKETLEGKVENLQLSEIAVKEAEEKAEEAKNAIGLLKEELERNNGESAGLENEKQESVTADLTKAASILLNKKVTPADLNNLKILGVSSEEIKKLKKNAENIGDILSKSRSFFGRLMAFFNNAGPAEIVVFFGSALAFLVLGLLYVSSPESAATTLSGILSVVSGVAGYLNTLHPYLQKAEKILEPFEQLKKQIETAQADPERVRGEITEELNERIAILQKEREAALRGLDQARRRRDEALRDKKDAQSGRYIARQILKRLESGEYQDHLGIASIIRKDFDALNEAIEEHNKIHKNKAGNGEDKGVNRIVLYVDDLDRLPAVKVIEVLQAIHLMLNFKLFVVVVAVDARWLTSALREHYSGMFGRFDTPHDVIKETDTSVKSGAKNGGQAQATPYDYLEKIFQIPYWITPMGDQACSDMIAALTAKDLGAGDDGGSGEMNKKKAKAIRTPHGPVAKELQKFQKITSDHRVRFVDKEDAEPPLRTVQILSSDEVEAMKSFAPLVGKTPRNVNRFVNTYRLLKAGGQGGFVIGDDKFVCPMLLLALVTGAPHAARISIDGLDKARQKNANTWVAQVQEEAAVPAEKERIDEFLSNSGGIKLSDIKIAEIRRWAERVGQFSFV